MVTRTNSSKPIVKYEQSRFANLQTILHGNPSLLILGEIIVLKMCRQFPVCAHADLI